MLGLDYEDTDMTKGYRVCIQGKDVMRLQSQNM